MLSAAVFAASSANAQVVHLSHNNSSADINLNGTGSSAGMTNWTVEGVNQLSQQWFWFRTGAMGSEQPINAIGGLTYSQPDSRTLYSSYYNSTLNYGVRVDYLLTGGGPRINPTDKSVSDISETISITNGGTTSLEFHFYQYSNFQLGGDSSDTTIRLGQNLRHLFNEASVTKTNSHYTFAVSETVVSPGANRGEVALFSDTLGRLSNGSVDPLNNVTGPIGSVGNVGPTWAFEWDLIIAPGSSLGISKDKFLEIAPTPEPSTAALLGLGAAAALVFRRRRR